MQTTHVEVRRGSRTLPALSGSHKAAPPKAVAFDNLQTAILRLASQLPARPGGFARQELGSLVNQALEAYRLYMNVMSS